MPVPGYSQAADLLLAMAVLNSGVNSEAKRYAYLRGYQYYSQEMVDNYAIADSLNIFYKNDYEIASWILHMVPNNSITLNHFGTLRDMLYKIVSPRFIYLHEDYINNWDLPSCYGYRYIE